MDWLTWKCAQCQGLANSTLFKQIKVGLQSDGGTRQFIGGTFPSVCNIAYKFETWFMKLTYVNNGNLNSEGKIFRENGSTNTFGKFKTWLKILKRSNTMNKRHPLNAICSSILYMKSYENILMMRGYSKLTLINSSAILPNERPTGPTNIRKTK